MKKIAKIFGKFIKGFTLVELVAVVTLMAIGAAIAIPNLRGTMTRAEQKKYETYLISAKTNVQNYVDLLNMSEFKYSLMGKDGVTPETHMISNSGELNKVLNLMNFETAYEYYIYDAKPTSNGKTKYYVDSPTTNPLRSALSYTEKGSFTGTKDIMIVIITRNESDKFTLKYLFFVDRSEGSIMLTYKVQSDTIVKGYVR